MPRGHKSKGYSHCRHHHTLGDSQGFQHAKPTAEGKSVSPPVGQANSASSSDASTQRSVFPASPDAGVPSTVSDVDAKGSDVSVDAESRHAFQSEAFTQPIFRDALTRKASMLVEFLLQRFRKSEEFTYADMLKVVGKKYKKQFPDILRKSSFRIEMVFGMQLKKINPNSRSYAIVSKLGLTTAEILRGRRGLPKMGLLITILGLILTKGDHATEEEIWQLLNVLGVYAGRKHLIFGEPRKLITKDLVEQNYLEIHKMSEDNPPKYYFLWGSRAHAETSKMTVLEVWAKINDTVPSFFSMLYEVALKEQTERTEEGYVALGCTSAVARVHPRCMSCTSSHK
ncbi:melanoma-associated antigen B4-like [Acomys russatus]|uniref:melanoma-associated antigen B4-like n=1 Tax=Acomys russatus TaxID=60746 RepID=UPI0021E30958|nr:melanoma-associated antigen B4-like [Acomys russatus]